MAKLTINSKPFCVDTFYQGTYTTDISEDENEYRQGDFEFVIRHAQSDAEAAEVTIEWTEDVPSNQDFAEEEILNKFYTQMGIE